MSDIIDNKNLDYDNIINQIRETGKHIILSKLSAQNQKSIEKSIQTPDTPLTAHVGATYVLTLPKDSPQPLQHVSTYAVDCPDHNTIKHIEDKELLKSLILSEAILQAEGTNRTIRDDHQKIIRQIKEEEHHLTVPIIAAVTVENIFIQCNHNIKAANAAKPQKSR